MNLQNLNLVELNSEETQKIEGGNWGIFLIAVAWSAWDNASDFPDGFSAGHSAYHP